MGDDKMTKVTQDKNSTQRKRSVEDFQFGRILGEGSYSTVVEATEKSNGRVFAAKVLSKRFIIRENKVKYVNIEKQALTLVGRGSKFIIRLHYTFQDSTRLFYILDLANNGELAYYLKKKGTFSLEITKFYLSEILMALEYLHSKGIAHRDLKPENILLDQNMHIKLTDFGSAKILNSNIEVNSISESKTNSFVGTAEFASPELLEDKDANLPSDLWAFGCMVYQFLLGSTPFKANSDYLIFQRIVALDYHLPEVLDLNAKDLILKLLVREPKLRLGADGIDKLKGHSFFNDMDFDNLHLLTPPSFGIPPPIIEMDDLLHLDEFNIPLV